MQKINIQNSFVQEIKLSLLSEQRINLFIKRDDLIHPFVSGNKWRKLHHNIALCLSSSCRGVVTFGGAYSNHVLACAAACNLYNIESIAYIRGDELSTSSNKLLMKCADLGMKLIFVARPVYDDMKKMDEIMTIGGDSFLCVPEGGANRLGIKGCVEIMSETENDYDFVALSQGTTTTSLGVLFALKSSSRLVVFPSLKGFGALNEMEKLSLETNYFNEWQENRNRVIVQDEFHFGGYGKVTNNLISFIAEFEEQTNVPLDTTYTGKAMFGLLQYLKKNEIRDKKVLFIHTGGTQKLD